MRRLVVLIALVAGTLGSSALGGCVTPSIPIPPPDPALMRFELMGDVGNTFASFAYPSHPTLVDAVVFVYNRDKGEGVIKNANSDGSVGPTQPLRADVGDQMVVSFQREEQTASTCVRLNATGYCDQ